jgi:TM2 domain-containing membrane protein YozV
MRKFKKMLLVLTVITIGLTSATIAPKTKSFPGEKIEALSNAIDVAKLDGKVTKAELLKIATIAKGENLSFKEKVALKIFGKKIGNKIMESTKTTTAGEKSQLIALLICFFVGGLGIHRFYLGYTWQGIVQLLTFGGCGIWVLIDFIRIIMGTLKPKDGEYDKTL